jgi:hypothetical protein
MRSIGIFIVCLIFLRCIENKTRNFIDIKTLTFNINVLNKKNKIIKIDSGKLCILNLLNNKSSILRSDTILNLSYGKIYFRQDHKQKIFKIASNINDTTYLFIFYSDTNSVKMVEVAKYINDSSFYFQKLKREIKISIQDILTENVKLDDLYSKNIYYSDYQILKYKYQEKKLNYKFISINGKNWTVEPPTYEQIESMDEEIYYDIDNILLNLPNYFWR